MTTAQSIIYPNVAQHNQGIAAAPMLSLLTKPLHTGLGYPLPDTDTLGDCIASGELVLFCSEDRKRFRQLSNAATNSNGSQAGQLSSALAPPNVTAVSQRELLRGVFPGGGQFTSQNDSRAPGDTSDV